MTCNPWAVSSGNILFGVIPLEHMDLMADPVSQTLAGAHGEREEALLL